MSEYDEGCEEDQRNFFDVFVQALEGADRVIVETRNALGDFDAHYMTAPKLLTESKALKAQVAGLLRIVGDKHDALCRIEELEAQLEKAVEALRWCAGSPDFNEGGISCEGWNNICAPIAYPKEQPDE